LLVNRQERLREWDIAPCTSPAFGVTLPMLQIR